MTIKNLVKSKVLIIFVLVLMVAAIFLIFPEIQGQYIKRIGINIKPEIEIELLYSNVYLQTDSRWKDEYLAQTEYTLSQQGCLTCVIAMNMCYYDYDVVPTDVNNDFIAADAYTEDGLLIWNKINDAYNNIEYDYKKVFSSKTIEDDLQAGILPIVKVRYKKTGIFHWVLIVGAENGEYLILDPLDKFQKPVSLNIHGKVYAYRVLIKND